MSTDHTTVPDAITVDLAVSGMTCASCVARVEKRLARVPGATATVNLPLESARVTLLPVDGHVADDTELVAAVERAGYTARVTRTTRPAEPAAAAVQAAPHGSHAASAGGSRADDAAPSGPVDHSAHVADATDTVAHALSAHGAGHDHDPDADTSAPEPDRGVDLRRRLRTSAVLAVPVVALSMIPALQVTGWQWVVAALSLPVVTWGALPFHRAALRAGRHGGSTMDTLVSIGVIVATGWSLWALLLGGAGRLGMTMEPTLIPRRAHSAMPELYFEVAVVVTTFLLAGRYAEHRSRRRAGDALRALLEMGAKTAIVRRPDGAGAWTEHEVPTGALQVGDEIVVRPGEKIATDGVVVAGSAGIDTSLLTGEPVPVDVSVGDAVTGATINTDGHLVVRATRVGEDTTLAQMGRLVADAQSGKAPVQRLADRISAVFVPVVLVLAVGTLVAWLVVGGTDAANVQAAFTAAVAVLIIACPCALGLATPTALLVGTGRAAQLGVVIKGPETLESTRRIDTVVLDKTGTVTAGAMEVADVVPLRPSVTAEEALRYAAAIEAGSEHPIARAITAAGAAPAPAAAEVGVSTRGSALEAPTSRARTYLGEEGDGTGVGEGGEPTVGADGVVIGSLQALDFATSPGGGVSGTVRTAHSGPHVSRRVVVGKPGWVADQTGVHDDAAEQAVLAAEEDGATAVVVAWNGQPQAVVVLRDPVKETSAAAIAELRSLGLRPFLVTGDNAGAARRVAREVGIDPADVVAGVLPEGKVDVVARLQDEGRVVAVVGDGVNDAAALAQAGRQGLGMAMGTGTDVAIQASDITLVRGDLRAAAAAVRISRATLRIIKQNLFWAFAYNVAAIPLAATGLLNPMIAGAAMALSSVLVVTNSLRLRRAS
ncbi:copper-translocating P-type ATPase [Sanguibacter hominis ATCC BAA-789]|uniref:Copper-translocating P-type ATPase n=1 Tax=Sanguibacter hominis ATCC BAA-789 TaxID=1312740 RepID=A0A9X5FF61_9MICO|nr:heavy metal translocating P-type ATPase [Sanguibacter hominis]NKX92896.1 copper-translocating P-type ATPase [Sanguibacter hominis ATCC BAA-789]